MFTFCHRYCFAVFRQILMNGNGAVADDENKSCITLSTTRAWRSRGEKLRREVDGKMSATSLIRVTVGGRRRAGAMKQTLR